jgi:regulator of sigma E protease
MIDESFDKDYMDKEPEEWEFRSKPAWQRLIIMLGGVTINIILGYLIFSLIAFTWGSSYIPTSQIQNGIYVDSLGYEMGLRTGDKILKIGDEDFEKFNPGTILKAIIIDDARTISVNREGTTKVVPIDEKYVQVLTGPAKDKFLFNARTPFEISAVAKESAADKAGLKPNDKVLSYNNIPIEFYDELALNLRSFKNQSFGLKYEREGKVDSTTVAIGADGILGIFQFPLNRYFDIEKEEYNFSESLIVGKDRANGFIKDQLKAFKKIFAGKIKAKDSLGSFISIGNMFPSAWDWQVFWSMTAMLSLILGILNLLPIPGLDGGHVMFLIWEVITGRKASDKVVEYATMVGFVILIALMIFAVGLDIRRLF